MYSGQATDISRNDTTRRVQKAWKRDDATVIRFRSIGWVAPKRIVITNAVRIVSNVIPGRLVAPRLSRCANLDANTPS
jgi:hypothetical protein